MYLLPITKLGILSIPLIKNVQNILTSHKVLGQTNLKPHKTNKFKVVERTAGKQIRRWWSATFTLDDDPTADYDGIKRVNALEWMMEG